MSLLRQRLFVFFRSGWKLLKALEYRNELVLLLINPYFIPKKLLKDVIQQEASQSQGSLLVDVGCGWQPYKHYFASFETYLGVDTAEERKPDIVASAEAIPLDSAIADFVLCLELIEHTPEPLKVCTELARILKEDGKLVLSAPMSWNLQYEPHDYYRFTSYGLTYLVEEVGLEVTKIVRIGGLFSLIGSRLADVIQQKLKQIPFIKEIKLGRILTTLLVAPINAIFYTLGQALDPIDQTDAIGWLVVAQKRAINSYSKG